MFSSFSPLQNGYCRQNWRLQALQDFLEARVRRSGLEGFLGFDGASRATMVELPKQVHLQNDVGAGGRVSEGCGEQGRN
jgi:hypothetical protein